MAINQMMFGSRDSFGLSLQWQGHQPATAAEWTRGFLSVWVGERLVWGSTQEDGSHYGIEWTWVELLEYLAEAWPFLVWEQAYPTPLNPQSPMHLEGEIEKMRGDESSEYADVVFEEVLSFLDVHDLARAVNGASVPPVRLLRQGDLFVVSTFTREVLLAASDVLSTLAEVGDAIAERLDSAGDERANKVRRRWSERDYPQDELFILQFGARLDPLSHDAVRPFLATREGQFLDDEVLATARMTAGLLESDRLEYLMRQIRGIGKIATPILDQIGEDARRLVMSEGKAYEQGYEIARYVRPKLPDTDASQRIEIEDVLRQLGILVKDIELETDELDAVAVFGRSHGPAILVNRDGVHSQGALGRRATFAHELCHLLVDRDGALPFAEALGPMAPVIPEKRARAFAAELLVPQDVAVEVAMREKRTTFDDWSQVVDSLRTEFGASEELVAWQLINGHYRNGCALAQNHRHWLRQLARRRRKEEK